MSNSETAKTYRMVISCPDAVGIVAEVSQFVADHGGSFVESNHYTDVEGGWFYLRNVINAPTLSISLTEMREKFAPIAEKFNMKWHVRASNEK